MPTNKAKFLNRRRSRYTPDGYYRFVIGHHSGDRGKITINPEDILQTEPAKCGSKGQYIRTLEGWFYQSAVYQNRDGTPRLKRIPYVRPCAGCGKPLFFGQERAIRLRCHKCAARARYEAGQSCARAQPIGTVRPDGPYLSERVAEDDPLLGEDKRGNGDYWMPQHRLVMARAIGRRLRKSETVHHINGDGTDNRLENLQLRSKRRHGPGQIARCLECGSTHVQYVGIGDKQETIV